MKEAGIICPEAVKVKENVLIMEMLGNGLQAYPRLRDVKLSVEERSNVYLECLFLLRKMFIKVDTVHGDFSEFNLLYDKSEHKLFVIDVSQSVHSHHPLAFEFLKRDIYNINFYFNKLGIPVFSLSKIFEFIVDKELDVADKKSVIEKMMEWALDDMEEDPEKKEFESFLGVNVPRNLFDLDLDQVNVEMFKHNYHNKFYSKMIGLGKVDEKREEKEDDTHQKEIEQDNEENLQKTQLEEDPSKVNDDNETKKSVKTKNKLEELVLMDDVNKFGEIDKAKKKEKKIIGDAKYGHLTKKERKKLIKEENREKRKNKMPKKMKKKLINKKRQGNKK
jgi:RIO kinase 1